MNAVKNLIQKLNLADECANIEAKRGTAINRSIMETLCAFANEPEMGGGHLLLGVEREQNSLFPQYVVTGVTGVDKLQLDLSTQCAAAFNQPIRPEIGIEQIGDKTVLNVYVPELPPGQKPVYFKNEGLPRGAYRRIGSSDQRCTDDDLFVFYNKEDSLDSSIIKDSDWDDISEEAIALYRNLRKNVNPYAEELQYSDKDLLRSLGCIKKENGSYYLTYAGLLVFGKRQAHRRLIPLVRVDFIRVPGNEWVEDPEKRFTTVDMRGSLLEMVQRTFSLIADDLPKGFLLPEAELQATSVGLPTRVLREAIVNAFIHRTYRENQPVQIIRYGNRIEIKNPGFSLKPEEHLGEPGSRNRNPFIAAIFHETNLAETKGSGIRTMRNLMDKAQLMPPTFESDHTKNEFTIRLLLHHFLNEQDIYWLSLFDKYGLNIDQKKTLVFVREVGAIDNITNRQVNGIDVVKASTDLRTLREKEIVQQKGKGRYTYYIPGPHFIASAPVPAPNTPATGLNTPATGLNTPATGLNTPAIDALPGDIKEKIEALGKRTNDARKIKDIIAAICSTAPFKANDIAKIFNKEEDYFKRKYLAEMIADAELQYTHPEMINHPDQAYRSAPKKQ
jgi:ATP-dependent DNA helicase RecG